VPAPERARRSVVTNLRDQSVEIHHGGRVVVIEPRGQIELDELTTGADHLAELERQELVSVASPQPVEERAKATAGRGSQTRRSRSTGAKRASSDKQDTTPPKPPEGGS